MRNKQKLPASPFVSSDKPLLTDGGRDALFGPRRSQDGAGDDKRPDTPIDAVIVAGIEITSRWGVWSEMMNMAEAVTRLPMHMREAIRSAWCDSNASHCYCFNLHRTADTYETRVLLGQLLSGFIIDINGGHNGVYVGQEHFDYLETSPDWTEFKEHREEPERA